jgi:hypothetical protein
VDQQTWGVSANFRANWHNHEEKVSIDILCLCPSIYCFYLCLHLQPQEIFGQIPTHEVMLDKARATLKYLKIFSFDLIFSKQKKYTFVEFISIGYSFNLFATMRSRNMKKRVGSHHKTFTEVGWIKKLAPERHYRELYLPHMKLENSTSLEEMNAFESIYQHILIKDYNLKFGLSLFTAYHKKANNMPNFITCLVVVRTSFLPIAPKWNPK